MSLSEETLRRLIVSRQLLAGSGGQLTPQADAVAVARAILAAHDAAELALAAIASALSVTITDKVFLTDYPSALEKAQSSVTFPGRGFLTNLNRARNNFKHFGILPHVPEW